MLDTLSLSPNDAPPAAGRRRGAVMFVVAMTIAVLASVGMYALAAASSEVRTSGNERQNTQTHYLPSTACWATPRDDGQAQFYLGLMCPRRPDTVRLAPRRPDDGASSRARAGVWARPSSGAVDRSGDHGTRTPAPPPALHAGIPPAASAPPPCTVTSSSS